MNTTVDRLYKEASTRYVKIKSGKGMCYVYTGRVSARLYQNNNQYYILIGEAKRISSFIYSNQ